MLVASLCGTHVVDEALSRPCRHGAKVKANLLPVSQTVIVD